MLETLGTARDSLISCSQRLPGDARSLINLIDVSAGAPGLGGHMQRSRKYPIFSFIVLV